MVGGGAWGCVQAAAGLMCKSEEGSLKLSIPTAHSGRKVLVLPTPTLTVQRGLLQ